MTNLLTLPPLPTNDTDAALRELERRLLMMPANDDESAEAGFDMNWISVLSGSSDHPCGTAGCIDGWIAVWNGQGQAHWEISALGVDEDQAALLCSPGVTGCHDAYDATPQQAAAAVRILRETGEVDWPRAMKEGAQ